MLASAYPVLQNAVDGGKANVTFVSTKFSLDEFQHEIDDLLSMQDRSKNAGKRQREEAFAKANIGNRRPRILVSCREVMDRIIAEKVKFEHGLITHAELEEAKERIVREAHDEVDSRHERRAVG